MAFTLAHPQFPLLARSVSFPLTPMSQSQPQPPPSLPAPLRLPVPTDQGLFALHTDHYSWTDILTDLERLPDQDFSAVLDVEDTPRWARFVWVRGQLGGGLAASGQDVDLTLAARALPRAHVSLVQVEPQVAEMLWECRRAPARLLPTPWPALHAELEQGHFYGVLVAGDRCSFWAAGRVVSGSLPVAGARCYALDSSETLGRDDLVALWTELMVLTARFQPEFPAVWRQACLELSGRYPVLDPFAGEVTLRGQRLEVSEEAPVQELRPALLSCYRTCLRRLGLRLRELPTQTLEYRAAWPKAGLGDA